MAIKDILVHVTDGDDCPARVDAAVALAAAHDARLTGVYTLFVPPMPSYVQSQIGNDLIAQQHRVYEKRADDARAVFDERAAKADISSEWRCLEGRRAEVLTIASHYCDLLVMGRHEVDDSDQSVDLVEAVVLASGKPVLVVPDEGAPRGIGRHAMVAWNGTREAVRAVDSALPLLEKAERVDVLAVDPHDGLADAHGAVPGADLSARLARHGVRAEAQAVSSDGHGVGETLLARAVADGVDLLVMGAYGHARWRELVMGGATAHVLRHSRLPLLMAH